MPEAIPQRLTKRRFLQLCLAGGCALSLGDLSALAEGVTMPSAPQPGDEEPGKWSKEAVFWAPSAGGVRCLKCPHGCVLAAGQMGKCRNRVNIRNRMYTIAYGNPCAVHVDPVEKKPLFHFLPSTRTFSVAVAGCNFRCLNCQNWQISQVSPRETENTPLMPEEAVRLCHQSGCASISYTYSEPTTFYEYAYDTAAAARKAGLRNIRKSNGYINEEPLRKLCRVIDAANIDLKGFDDRVYSALNGGTLAPVLRTLQILREERVWLEITNLVIPSWTDDQAMIRKMADWLCAHGLQDAPLHFSRFTPLYRLTELPATPVSALEKAAGAARQAGMHHVYIGNVPGHNDENTRCSRCGEVVVERKGFTVTKNALAAGKCGKCGEPVPGVWQ